MTEQYAAFGEVTYSPNEDWSFTAGLRWFDHTRTRDYFTQQPNGNFTSNLGTAKNSTSDFTKKLSVQYNINDERDGVRALLRRLPRRRAQRRPARRPSCRPTTTRTSSTTTSSASRAGWAGGRYTLNLTAFKMEWKDYQIEVTDPGPLFAVLVANVGDAEIEGVTLDFSAFLCDSLDIGLNLQLLDPKTKANDPQLGLAAGRAPAVLRGGERRDLGRVHVPRRDRGRKHLCPLPVELHGQFAEWPPDPILDDRRTATSKSDIIDPTLQPAYQLSDFKIGLAADDWEIYAYVDNMFNERAIYFDQATESSGSGPTTSRPSATRAPGASGSRRAGDRATEHRHGAAPEAGAQGVAASARTRVERMRKRGHYDRETIDAILDAGLICHVGFVVHARARRDPDPVLARG